MVRWAERVRTIQQELRGDPSVPKDVEDVCHVSDGEPRLKRGEHSGEQAERGRPRDVALALVVIEHETMARALRTQHGRLTAEDDDRLDLVLACEDLLCG